MASRTKQKEEARARRLAEERARAEQAQRTRRMRMLGGVILVAVVIVGVAIGVSIGGGGSGGTKKVTAGTKAANANVAAVSSLLNGIPESGMTLGSPSAPVTITEYADLECPVCDAFALPASRNTSDGTPSTGYFDQLVNQYVRTGKAKIVYRSLETATGNGPNASMWTQQQAGALSAGLQHKAWYYIELFYYEQQSETSAYVNPAFIRNVAQQVPGLNLSQWSSNLNNPSLTGQVNSDGQAAAAKGYNSTPTIIVQGPKGAANPIVGLPQSYSQLTSYIKQVS